MSKVYLFAIMLLAASLTGCIEELDVETQKSTTSDEDETIKPVGKNDTSGQPGVEFIGIAEGYDTVFLIAASYDPDGYIISYSIESTSPHEDDCAWGLYLDNDCFPLAAQPLIVDICYELEYVNQTITAKIEDNDGNNASAEYELVEDDFSECEYYISGEAPMATFFVQEGSDGIYHVDVIKVSKQEDLAGFSFYLKDGTGSTYVGQGHGFGEVAMQIVGGEEHGIDMAYGGGDPQLDRRAANVSDDDGTDYPVLFNDNDRDGKLSAGDQFMVYGSGNAANGPASDNWRLDIQFDASGDIIGSAKML